MGIGEGSVTSGEARKMVSNRKSGEEVFTFASLFICGVTTGKKG